MNIDLATQFIQGHLDEALVEIELSNAQTVLLRSSVGRLFVTSDKKLTMHIHAPSIPGNFPTKDYGEFDGLTIRGITNSGWQFSTLVFILKPLSYLPEQDLTVWSTEPYEVALHRSNDAATDIPITYVSFIDRLDCLFEKTSTRTAEGAKYPTTSLDWLEIESASASIQIHQGVSKWSILKIEMKTGTSIAEFTDVLQAFLNALSLRMGRRIDVLATTIIHNHRETTQLAGFHLTRLKHTGNNPIVPLTLRNGMGSNFLIAAMQYFQSHKDSPLIDHLYSVWDAELISRENHRLQLAIAIDGFSKYVNKLQPSSHCTQTELKRRADEDRFSQLKDVVLQMIETIDFDKGLLNRMKNVVKRASLNDASPMIKSAGESLGIIFTEDELGCWRGMRHAAAHGDRKEFDEREVDFFSCQSMLYRMVLRLVDWFGPVIPYGPHAKYVSRNESDSDKPVQVIRLSTIKEIKRVEV